MVIVLNTVNSRADTTNVCVQAFPGVYHLNRHHDMHWKAQGNEEGLCVHLPHNHLLSRGGAVA